VNLHQWCYTDSLQTKRPDAFTEELKATKILHRSKAVNECSSLFLGIK